MKKKCRQFYLAAWKKKTNSLNLLFAYQKIYYSKNGTFQASGNPAGNSNGLSIDSGVTYFFAANDDTGTSTTSRWIWNFGQNPMFSGGTSAGGNKDSNGRGNFKYSVPSGFLAVCTKNLGV